MRIAGPAELSISGTTITANSAGTFGGGLGLAADFTLAMTDSIVSGNSARTHGGGIFLGGGATTIRHSTIESNVLTGFAGGGVYNGGTLSLDDVQVLENRTTAASATGADIHNARELTIHGGKFERNQNVGGSGGAINNTGTLTINTTSIQDNDALSGDGGGIDNAGDMALSDAAFSGNSAGSVGGGINNRSRASLDRVLLSANKGGTTQGVHNGVGATLTMTNSTVSGHAGGDAAVRNAGRTTLVNVTVADGYVGIADEGVDALLLRNTLVFRNATDCISRGRLTSQGHNLDGDGTCLLHATGDLSERDARLGVLADNGGFSQTHALLPHSSAIDAAVDCPGVDQRGVVRPLDGNGDGSQVCDIGAYEAELANHAPTADAGGPYTLIVPGSIQINGSGSDPDGDMLSFAWNLNPDQDGSFETEVQRPRGSI